MNTHDQIDLSRIETKLDTLIRLLAVQVGSDCHSVTDRALLLQRSGLPPKEIANLCGTTPHTVSVILSAAKGKGRKKGKKRSKR